MSRKFSIQERRALYMLSGGRCEECGELLPDNWHSDHVQPWSRGGPTDVINGQALCPKCNQRKGAKPLFSLRPWQKRFQTEYFASTALNFLLVCLPGGGKTVASLSVAKQWLENAGVKPRLIIHVSPLRELKKQFQKAARKEFRLEFQTSEFSDGEKAGKFSGVVKAGMNGLCFTYAGMANAAGAIRGLCARYEIMVILDEPHHMSVEGAWGRQCKEAFEHATKRLFMTGTPWRHDMEDMPFLKRNEDGTYKSDHVFDWPLALEEDPRCIRILVFRHFDTTTDYEDKETREILSLDSRDRLSKNDQDRWLNGAIKGNEMITEMIGEAHNKLMQVRALKPDAAGLIVCEDIKSAQGIAKKFEKITGVRPHLIVSDDEVSDETIQNFSDEKGIWIVSVRKVSEGIDIPRLIVGVFLTNYTTELYFRQFVGRVARNQGTEYDKEAYVFIPKHWLLMEYAQKIEELQAVALKEKGPGEGAGDPPAASRTNYLGDRDAQLAGVIIPNRGESIDTHAIEAMMKKYRSAGMTETLAAQLLKDNPPHSEPEPEPSPSRDGFDDRPLEEQLDYWRKKVIAPKARQLAFALGADDDPTWFKTVQTQANDFSHCRNVQSATLDQLKAMSAYLDNRLAELRRKHAS